ncbi:MAG: hypothetical protein ACRDYD_08840 [Acidimicrobiales bacterium]
MGLLAFHEAWAWVVILGNGLAGVWALAARRVESLRTRAMWWFTVSVEAAVFVQVATGVAMVAGQHRTVTAFHPFYGFVAIVAVGFFYAYRAALRRQMYLLYGLGGLFVMGLGVRALITAKGG